MTTDEKIDELLRIVKGHEARFDQLEAGFGARFDRLEARDIDLLKLIVEQRDSFEEERKLTKDRFAGMDHQIKGLHSKLDKFQESLSADLQAFGEDLYRTIHRIERLEKKFLS